MKQIVITRRLSKLYWILDYAIFPILILIVIYDPNFMHGFVDHFEAGKELACINEVLYGRALYKEIFTLFGPLNIYLETLAMVLFGKHLAVLSSYFYFGTIITLIIGYFIGRRLCNFRLFSYALALSLILETTHPFWASRWGGFRFGFGLLAILCSVNFFAKEKYIWIFFAGACAAVAFLTSLDTGVLALIAIGTALFCYAIFNFPKRKNLFFRSLVIFGIGIAVVFIPFSIYFAFKGALLPYLETVIEIIKNHVKVWGQERTPLNLWECIRPDQIYSYNFKYIFSILLYIAIAIYLIRRMLKKAINGQDYGVLSLSIYGLMMYKASFRVMIGPQFQMALQPVIILVFIFLEKIFTILKYQISYRKNALKLVAILALFIFMISYLIFSEKRFYGTFKGWALYQNNKKALMPMYAGAIPFSNIKLSTLAINRGKGIIVPSEQVEEMEGVTNYILSATSPDEVVFTFPEHGIYNFLSDRPCLGRFNIAGLAWTTSKWKEEMLEDLKKTGPRYIIFSRKLSNLAMSINRTEELLPEVIDYIKANYKREISFGSIDILKRGD